jgi:hypothetical protein
MFADHAAQDFNGIEPLASNNPQASSALDLQLAPSAPADFAAAATRHGLSA